MNNVLKKISNFSKEDLIKDMQKKANELLQDNDMKDYLMTHNFTNEDVYNNPYIFEDCLNSIKAFKKRLNHLEYSDEKLDGYILGVQKIDDNYFQFHELTKEMSKYLNDKKHLNKYVINHAENLYRVSLSDLNTEEETDTYINLYKFLNRGLLQMPKKGLYIYGDLGVGKTYALVAYLNDLARKDIEVAFCKTSTFVSEIKMIDNFDERDLLINRVKKSNILVLDDIGSEMNTAYTKDDILLPILDYRMENKLLTYFTSNYDLKALEELYSDYGKKMNDRISAKRLIERIKTLSNDYELCSFNKRHKL